MQKEALAPCPVRAPLILAEPGRAIHPVATLLSGRNYSREHGDGPAQGWSARERGGLACLREPAAARNATDLRRGIRLARPWRRGLSPVEMTYSE